MIARIRFFCEGDRLAHAWTAAAIWASVDSCRQEGMSWLVTCGCPVVAECPVRVAGKLCGVASCGGSERFCPRARLTGRTQAVVSSPTTPTSEKQTGTGYDKPAAGHFMSEAGQPQGSLETGPAKGCTSPVNPPPSCGQFQSTTGAQPEHNGPGNCRSICGTWWRPGKICRTWCGLP